MTLAIDTGTPWTWIASQICETCNTENKYEANGSAEFNNSKVTTDDNLVVLQYLVSNATGQLATDTVALLGDTISNFSFALVNNISDIDMREFDGVLGLGPKSDNNFGLDSFLERLVEDGIIDNTRFSISLAK